MVPSYGFWIDEASSLDGNVSEKYTALFFRAEGG
jgi:hypothetical protein